MTLLASHHRSRAALVWRGPWLSLRLLSIPFQIANAAVSTEGLIQAKISVGRIGAGVASNAAGLGVAYGVSRQGLLDQQLPGRLSKGQASSLPAFAAAAHACGLTSNRRQGYSATSLAR